MPDLAPLRSALDAAATGLTNVSPRTMFGCHALFNDGAIFGLVWKAGRIGVRLPDETAFGELMKQSGSAPWMAGPMKMAHWVLVPEKMHKDAKTLGRWVARAHALNAGGAPAKKAPSKKAAAKKVAAKKAPTKKRPAAKAPAKKVPTKTFAKKK